MNLVSVITDSREPKAFQELDFGVPHTVEKLDVGDAWLNCDSGVTIVVERSTLSDLVGKIPDGGLMRQAAAIRGVTEWGYLVWTGKPWWVPRTQRLKLGGRDTKWEWSNVQGALLTVQDLGVCVMHVPSDAKQEYKKALIRLANRSRGDIRLRAKREAWERSPGAAVLCSFAGISDKLAEQLLERCGTAMCAIEAIANGHKLPNIGPITRANVRYALGMVERSEIQVAIKQEEQSE